MCAFLRVQQLLAGKLALLEGAVHLMIRLYRDSVGKGCSAEVINTCSAHREIQLIESCCRPVRQVHSNTWSSGVAGDAATSEVCGEKTGRFRILDFQGVRVIDCSLHL